jgi:hypothetical protein
MSEEQRPYISYLLRLWQAQSQEGLVWRASLEHASTGERQGFASLADLLAFLEQATAAVRGVIEVESESITKGASDAKVCD